MFLSGMIVVHDDMWQVDDHYSINTIGPIVFSDPRSQVKHILTDHLVSEWRNSKSQDRYSSVVQSCGCLWKWAVADGPVCGVGFILRAIAGTLQWSRKDGIVGERKCECGTVFSFHHISTCSLWKHFNEESRNELFNSIRNGRCSPRVCRKMWQWNVCDVPYMEVLKRLGLHTDDPSSSAAYFGAFVDADVAVVLRNVYDSPKEKTAVTIRLIRRSVVDRAFMAWLRACSCD